MYIIILLLLFISIISIWIINDVLRNLTLNYYYNKNIVKKNIPTGGISLFLSWITIILFFNFFLNFNLFFELYLYALAALVICLIGVYDEINGIPSLVKILIQIFIFSIIMNSENALINSMSGLFKIYHINEIFSVFSSLLVFLIIINAFNNMKNNDNLIIYLSLFFLMIVSYYYFKINYDYYLLIISFSMSLIIYLIYLIKNKEIKLGYVGNSGLGLVIAIISLNWMNTNHPIYNKLPIDSINLIYIMVFYPVIIYLFNNLNSNSEKQLLKNLNTKNIIQIIFFKISMILLNIYFLNYFDITIIFFFNVLVSILFMIFLKKTLIKYYNY